MAEKIDLSGFIKVPDIVQSEHYRTIYANSTKMGISPWDVRVTFGSVLERQPGITVNEEQVTIVMSPQQAKAVLKVLTGTIGSYENLFGEIIDTAAIIEKARTKTVAPLAVPETKKD